MYTRKGDRGETSLHGSTRVQKDDPRVEAYGTIDELSSALGVAISESKNRSLVSSLQDVQRLLFVAGGDMATDPRSVVKVPRITEADTVKLEKLTDDLISKLPRLSNFILPGGSSTGAEIHFARAVCRRAERQIVKASRSQEMNPELIRFFNRLSSYLFNLARWENSRAGKKDDVWKS